MSKEIATTVLAVMDFAPHWFTLTLVVAVVVYFYLKLWSDHRIGMKP